MQIGDTTPPDPQTALFLEQFKASGLQQLELAWLLGKHHSAIGRWVRWWRRDHLKPPRYAIGFLILWNASSARARQSMMDAVGAVQADGVEAEADAA